MRRIRALATSFAVVVATAACGGGGLPAIQPAEAAHLHAYDVSAMNMENTLRPGDVVAANDSVEVRRGSIVAFRGPSNWSLDGTPKTFISRVIAVGGDHIMCCDAAGNVVLNGHVLHEPYLFPGAKPSSMSFDAAVPAGRLWVMGDNRDMSADSRSHQQDANGGTIAVDDVIGVVTRILKPPSRARVLPH